MASIRGSQRLKDNIQRLIREAPDDMGKALYAVAQQIAAASKRRTPVLTGALRASHHVTRPKHTWNDISVTIEVGGPAADYAVHVHYRDELAHKVGESRFLEKSLNEAKAGMSFQLAKAFQRIVKAKVR